MSELNQLRLAAAVTLCLIVFLWVHKELSLSAATTLYLPLDPTPYSGMPENLLSYRLQADLHREQAGERGVVVVSLDERGVATFMRLHEPDIPLLDDEVKLGFQMERNGYRIGPQEVPFAPVANAKYARLLLDYCGRTTWLGFADDSLRSI